VTVCHSKTGSTNLRYGTTCSNIVITGIGKPRFFNRDFFGWDQTWIDCGINRDEEGHLCGDVDTDDDRLTNIETKITPVPGGVGTLTTAQLMANVVKAYEYQKRGKINGTY
jgi:methylenetetrahydrofolate dehydrogenase (NADP+)/methenyltetrahydrofolate cyclohydrolase